MPLFDAAAGLLSGGAAGGIGGDTSSAHAGPVAAGPVVVNVAGFGSKASGEAKAAASDSFPAQGGVAYSDETGLPSWAIPAAGAVLVLVLALALMKR